VTVLFKEGALEELENGSLQATPLGQVPPSPPPCPAPKAQQP